MPTGVARLNATRYADYFGPGAWPRVFRTAPHVEADGEAVAVDSLLEAREPLHSLGRASFDASCAAIAEISTYRAEGRSGRPPSEG